MKSPTKPRARVQNAIAALRKQRELTQAQFAELVGTSTTHVSRIETGESSLTQSMMTKIASALDIEPQDLFITSPNEGEINLDILHHVVKQLDEWLEDKGFRISAEDRADFTIELYRLEADRIKAAELAPEDVKVAKYENLLKRSLK
ncbi:MAG: helix-turn-helix transcriptional regulator [Lentilitoribacter sp.]